MSELARMIERIRTHASESRGCHERVADHTDTVDCGDAVLRRGLCATHLAANVSWLTAQRRKLVKQIADIDATLALLQSESG
jgi:hypothetical protein